MTENVLDKEERLDKIRPEDLTFDDLLWLLDRALPSYEDSSFSGHQHMSQLVRELMSRGRSFQETRAQAERMREAMEEILFWPNPVGLDDPVRAKGRLTENTDPPGDLYGTRLTTARQILRDALGLGRGN